MNEHRNCVKKREQQNGRTKSTTGFCCTDAISAVDNR